jgi:single-strand DNA-binding protein
MDRASGEQKEEVTWFRVSVWGKQAEAANQYLEQGRQVLVEGRIQPDPDTGGPRLWTRQDGTIGASFEIRAFRVVFLGGGGVEAGAGAPGAPAGGGLGPEEDEDIPF